MLMLLSSATSPFARKVRIVLEEKKVDYQLVEASPWVPDSPVARVNPLCKVPVLTLDDGTHLYDSRVIVDYIDSVSPVARLIPEAARQRVTVRRWEALADGICDALVLAVLEGRRKVAQRNPEWIERQHGKIEASIADMAKELEDKSWCNGEAYTLADIATGCALGYLDLRYERFDWRNLYPNLGKLAEKLAKRPAFAESVPPASA
jgi:glutathione S-transferase